MLGEDEIVFPASDIREGRDRIVSLSSLASSMIETGHNGLNE